MLRASIMLVTAPTPPGTGVMARTLSTPRRSPRRPRSWPPPRRGRRRRRGRDPSCPGQGPRRRADHHPVDAHVQDHGALFHLGRLDQLRHAGGHHQVVGPGGVLLQVALHWRCTRGRRWWWRCGSGAAVPAACPPCWSGPPRTPRRPRGPRPGPGPQPRR